MGCLIWNTFQQFVGKVAPTEEGVSSLGSNVTFSMTDHHYGRTGSFRVLLEWEWFPPTWLQYQPSWCVGKEGTAPRDYPETRTDTPDIHRWYSGDLWGDIWRNCLFLKLSSQSVAVFSDVFLTKWLSLLWCDLDCYKIGTQGMVV